MWRDDAQTYWVNFHCTHTIFSCLAAGRAECWLHALFPHMHTHTHTDGGKRIRSLFLEVMDGTNHCLSRGLTPVLYCPFFAALCHLLFSGIKTIPLRPENLTFCSTFVYSVYFVVVNKIDANAHWQEKHWAEFKHDSLTLLIFLYQVTNVSFISWSRQQQQNYNLSTVNHCWEIRQA